VYIKIIKSNLIIKKIGHESISIRIDSDSDDYNVNGNLSPTTKVKTKLKTPELKRDVEKPVKKVKVIRSITVGLNRHQCIKCGLEFTSVNSVTRHQLKSCLRIRVLTADDLKNSKLFDSNKMNNFGCGICGALFHNTHQLSIHIYKYHRSLLGPADEEVSSEARRLNRIQIELFAQNQ
jgi:uncharacterized C2H2 Zn-finger protein